MLKWKWSTFTEHGLKEFLLKAYAFMPNPNKHCVQRPDALLAMKFLCKGKETCSFFGHKSVLKEEDKDIRNVFLAESKTNIHSQSRCSIRDEPSLDGKRGKENVQLK